MNNHRAGPESTFPVGVLYVVAIALIVLPVADAMIGLFPVQPNQARWRMTAIGLLSGSMTVALVGFVMASVAAHLLNHLWMQRLLAVFYGILALGLLVGLVVFTLDALQLRREYVADLRQAYDRVAVKALLAQALLALVFLALCLTGFKQTRANARRAVRAIDPDKASAPVFSAPAKP